MTEAMNAENERKNLDKPPRKVAFLTDSCVDVSPDLLKKRHIYTVPMRILCDDGEYLDGVNIRNLDIYKRLKAGELPRTSLPRTEDLEAALKNIVDDGYDGIIAIMLSGGLSGTYNLTRLAAEAIREEIPDGPQMRVFDSKSGSLGQAMMILQASEDWENGMTWQELTEKRVPFLIQNTFPFFSVDTLEYLRKGGRIGRVTAAAGTLLQIKPILTFDPLDGRLISTAKARGRRQVTGKLVELALQAKTEAEIKAGRKIRRYNLAVANGGDPDGMEITREKLIAILPDYEHIWDGEIDGVLSVYIGDGVLGAAVQVLDNY